MEIEDVSAGLYELWVAGIKRGTINAQAGSNGVKGELEFSSPADAGKPLLNFDPRGQLIEVKTAAGVFFSHLFRVADTNSSVIMPLRLELPLFNQGFALAASASMKYRRDDRGRLSFQVEIENAPAGSYDLLVGGSPRATITVSATVSGTQGEVEFENEPDGGSLLLDFDPLGRDIVLRHNGDVYFERILPTEN